MPDVRRANLGPPRDPAISLAERYSRSARPIRRWLHARVHDGDVADDLASAVWERCARAERSGRPVWSEYVWISARCVLASHLRSRARAPVSFEEYQEFRDYAARYEPRAPESELDDELDDLRAALPRLSPSERTAITLYGQGYRRKEIGAHIGRSRIGVTRLLVSARLELSRDR